MLKKCIIPVIARGDNWNPIGEYVPKEMFPVLQYPVIHYIFQEAFRSGLNEIAIVITYEKEIIKDYLYSKFSGFIGKGFTLEFIYQEEALGPGNAIMECESFIQGEPFAVVIPDDLYFFQSFPLIRLIDIYKQVNPCTLLSLSAADRDSLCNYGFFNLQKKTSDLYTISKFFPGNEGEINSSSSYRSSLRIVGRYILPPSIFDYLREIKSTLTQPAITEEILFEFMLNKGEKIYGTEIKDRSFDIGTLEGFVKANNTFFNF